MTGNDGLCFVIERRGGNLICDLSEGAQIVDGDYFHCGKNVREWPTLDVPYVAFDVAFGGKAGARARVIRRRGAGFDVRCWGVKRTLRLHSEMSANDPKQSRPY